ncbi:MAG: hypothetical protein JNK88_02630 [Mangrovicoccus sp.]|nr:hypothetical protein [Mangrovicoccus sp.]
MLVKLLHVLAFSLALGGGVAAQVLMARIAAEPAAAAQIRPALRVIAHIGIGSVAVLWLSGLTLWGTRHGFSMELGGFWHLKLAAVAVLTGLACFAWGRMQAGRPLALPLARMALSAQLVAAVTAIAAALVVFD